MSAMDKGVTCIDFEIGFCLGGGLYFVGYSVFVGVGCSLFVLGFSTMILLILWVILCCVLTFSLCI